MVGLGAQAVVARSSCVHNPVLVNLVVSDDISPAIDLVARSFNRQSHSVDGRCVQVEVTPGEPGVTAAQIDGQDGSQGTASVDAWIPDSTLWVDVARNYPLGAKVVQPTGISVAKSPLMLVMPQSVAAKTRLFDVPVGWGMLLPPQLGGPAQSLGMQIDLPDPSDSAAGFATIIQMTRLLGQGQQADANFSRFVFNSQSTEPFDDPNALTAFTASAAPPWNRKVITVASEQAVIAYDQASSGHPLAAYYPSGPTSALGTPELDYPYVLTTSSQVELAAARQFGAALQDAYSAAVVRHYGFRSGDGRPDATPASFGLSRQYLRLATPVSALEAEESLQVWEKLKIGSRDLVLQDVSEDMAQPAGPGSGGLTLEQEDTQTASRGLPLFPDTTQMGLWDVANHLDGALPYQQLVPMGPLPSQLGLISRREMLQQDNLGLRPRHSTLALHSAILAAYQYMLKTYRAGDSNSVVVLTAGVDNARDDISLPALLTKLHQLYNPNKRVEIIIVMFGTNASDYAALSKIANATSGGAYEISNPNEVVSVFFRAIARRLCEAGCIR
jgi:Bacterial extracellular solute-binding protein